ncbi:hypothetical protein [Nocardia cyriacigeorgica]|uniref:hypothetical protein n=1 Tax=Nocardia cyriacigeorgica TaxID=135487 RepID=UPI002454479A|nr:hypothetical protein [Nocardia cyriacigeorgica]
MSTQMPPVEASVDIRPIAFDLAGAMAYTGLSKTKLNQLLRDEVIAARKEGSKNLFLRESLDRYIGSLPAWGSR